MKHQERTNIKRADYIAAGYECGKVFSDFNTSYFFSTRDGVRRKHTFTNTSIKVEVAPEEVVEATVEELPVVEVVVEVQPEPIKKKTRKKKGA
jgi:hypothetical protein